MILCDSARQCINICYSVIKFLEFRGFCWSGDSLPFRIQDIGDLLQTRITLNDQHGNKVEGAFMESGYLFAPFQKGNLYDLSLRLEYSLPIRAREFHCDFLSICPKDYETAIDFLGSETSNAIQWARVRLGDQHWDFDTAKSAEILLDRGQKISIFREREFRGIVVKASSDIPFEHRTFPALSLPGPV